MGEALIFVSNAAGADRTGGGSANSSGLFRGAPRPLSPLCCDGVSQPNPGDYRAAVFSGADGLIYLLMKSEDYAPSSAQRRRSPRVALTMDATRELDWRGGRDKA